MKNIQMTKNAIKKLVNHDIDEDITVQIINLKTQKRISCDLSDGLWKFPTVIDSKSITENDNYAFIKITGWQLIPDTGYPKLIYVTSYYILDIYTEKLGQPNRYYKNQNVKEEQQKIPIIDPQKFKSRSKSSLQSTQKRTQKNSDMTIQKAFVSSFITKTPKKQEIKDVNANLYKIQDYQKISDLYPDLANWQIVARLVKKIYKQFTSKSKGQLTKVLNVEFMDSTGMKITGAMFGDIAKQWYESLKQEFVYIVSKALIKEDQYSRYSGKYSRYSIIFNQQSSFTQCNDLELIPHSLKTLHDIFYSQENRNVGDQVDVVAILLSLQQQVEIPKQNRTLFKQTMEICDPVNEIRVEALIWNRSLIIDEKMVGKTIALYGFRLSKYNDKFSLNSGFLSKINLIENHSYKKYQGRVSKQNMQMLPSNKKQEQQLQEACKNIKELEDQMKHLSEGSQIKSTLTLMVGHINYKKWCYESCPNCRKTAEPNKRCNHCNKEIEETIPRFLLNVELSDFCGAISATFFEEAAIKLLGNYPEGIKGISQMQQLERRSFFQEKLYQQFTVTLSSKLDRDYTRHTVKKIYECDLISRNQETVRRIKNYL